MVNQSQNSNETQQPQPSFYINIPGYVFASKELEPNAKLLFGLIAGLTQMEQPYCWASNKYFAEKFDVDERTITRWLDSLQNNNFIRIETETCGIIRKRKIYIFDVFSRKDYERTKMSSRQDKNVRSDNKAIDTRETTTPKPPSSAPPPTKSDKKSSLFFYECLKIQNISDEEKAKVSAKYDEQTVKDALGAITSEGFVIKTTFIQALYWACGKKLKRAEMPENVIEQNKAFAVQVAQKAFGKKSFVVELLDKALEIVYPTAQKPSNVFLYEDKMFKQKINNCIGAYI